jgi:hypothetical protein
MAVTRSAGSAAIYPGVGPHQPVVKVVAGGGRSANSVPGHHHSLARNDPHLPHTPTYLAVLPGAVAYLLSISAVAAE